MKNKEEQKKLLNCLILKKEELPYAYLEGDVSLLACVFEKFIKVSINEFGITPLYCVSLRR